MDGAEIIGVVLIGVTLVVAIPFILREIACWYWKINKLVSTLESIDKTLKRIEIKSRPSISGRYDSGTRCSS